MYSSVKMDFCIAPIFGARYDASKIGTEAMIQLETSTRERTVSFAIQEALAAAGEVGLYAAVARALTYAYLAEVIDDPSGIIEMPPEPACMSVFHVHDFEWRVVTGGTDLHLHHAVELLQRQMRTQLVVPPEVTNIFALAIRQLQVPAGTDVTSLPSLIGSHIFFAGGGECGGQIAVLQRLIRRHNRYCSRYGIQQAAIELT
jgi:hypothetical protein